MKFRKVDFRNEVGSTNDELKKLLKNGEDVSGLVICASHQTGGRGQRGNAWESVPGKNLQFSFGFLPINLKSNEMHLLNQWVSVSIFRLLQNLGLQGVKIKWPNDILVSGKKICGILIENGLSLNGVEESIIGIGLNVNYAPKNLGATCIAEQLGIELSVKNLLYKLLVELEKSLSDIRVNENSIRTEYLQNLYGYDRLVRVIIDGKELKAKVKNVKPSGEIQLQIESKILEFGFKEFGWLLTR